ncbi:response regulator [Funiculus sociatus]
MQPEQQQRIMGYFIEEAKDHLNTIEQGLMNLQSTIEDPEMVNEVFRAAHSVKGGAAMLGLNSIQKASHRLEDSFKILKECPVKIDQKLESLFLRVSDTLKELIEQLSGPFGLTEDIGNSIMSGVEPVFEELNQHMALLVGGAGGMALEAANSTKAEAPMVMSAQYAGSSVRDGQAQKSVFTSDVLSQLREMLQLFKQPDSARCREKLQEICGSLELLGEQFELPKWSQLIRTAGSAIANPENSYRILASVVIKEIKQAQELVLAGRETSIEPSSQLKALIPLTTVVATGETHEAENYLQGAIATFESAHQTSDRTVLAVEAGNLHNHPVIAIDGDRYTDTPIQEEIVASVSSGATSWQEQALSPDVDNMFFEPANNKGRSKESATHRADPSGPEVGMAELNSLADLFEGESPELDETWQEEEVLSDVGHDLVNERHGESDFDEEGDSFDDFSDLLGDSLSGIAKPSPTATAGDELTNLFGEDFVDEATVDEQPSLQSVDDGFADMLFEDDSSVNTTSEDLSSLWDDNFIDEEESDSPEIATTATGATELSDEDLVVILAADNVEMAVAAADLEESFGEDGNAVGTDTDENESIFDAAPGSLESFDFDLTAETSDEVLEDWDTQPVMSTTEAADDWTADWSSEDLQILDGVSETEPSLTSSPEDWSDSMFGDELNTDAALSDNLNGGMMADDESWTTDAGWEEEPDFSNLNLFETPVATPESHNVLEELVLDENGDLWLEENGSTAEELEVFGLDGVGEAMPDEDAIASTETNVVNDVNLDFNWPFTSNTEDTNPADTENRSAADLAWDTIDNPALSESTSADEDPNSQEFNQTQLEDPLSALDNLEIPSEWAAGDPFALSETSETATTTDALELLDLDSPHPSPFNMDWDSAAESATPEENVNEYLDEPLNLDFTELQEETPHTALDNFFSEEPEATETSDWDSSLDLTGFNLSEANTDVDAFDTNQQGNFTYLLDTSISESGTLSSSDDLFNTGDTSLESSVFDDAENSLVVFDTEASSSTDALDWNEQNLLSSETDSDWEIPSATVPPIEAENIESMFGEDLSATTEALELSDEDLFASDDMNAEWDMSSMPAAEAEMDNMFGEDLLATPSENLDDMFGEDLSGTTEALELSESGLFASNDMNAEWDMSSMAPAEAENLDDMFGEDLSATPAENLDDMFGEDLSATTQALELDNLDDMFGEDLSATPAANLDNMFGEDLSATPAANLDDMFGEDLSGSTESLELDNMFGEDLSATPAENLDNMFGEDLSGSTESLELSQSGLFASDDMNAEWDMSSMPAAEAENLDNMFGEDLSATPAENLDNMFGEDLSGSTESLELSESGLFASDDINAEWDMSSMPAAAEMDDMFGEDLSATPAGMDNMFGEDLSATTEALELENLDNMFGEDLSATTEALELSESGLFASDDTNAEWDMSSMPAAEAEMDNMFGEDLSATPAEMDNMFGEDLSATPTEMDNMFGEDLSGTTEALELSESGLFASDDINAEWDMSSMPAAEAEMDDMFGEDLSATPAEMDNMFGEDLSATPAEMDDMFGEDLSATTQSLELENLDDMFGEDLSATTQDLFASDDMNAEWDISPAAMSPTENLDDMFGEDLSATNEALDLDADNLLGSELDADWDMLSAAVPEDADLSQADLLGVEPAEIGDMLDFEEDLFTAQMPSEDLAIATNQLNQIEALWGLTAEEENDNQTSETTEELSTADFNALSFEEDKVSTAEFLGADEFDELEALLGEDAIGDQITPDLVLNNEFDELDALLGEQETASADMLDEFADLEALLGDEPQAITPKAKQASKSAAPVSNTIDDEFGDLEILLGQAEETMGVPRSAKTSSSPVRPVNRTRQIKVFEQTMRVPVKHLDNLSNLVGELVVNRNTLEQDQERLRQFLDNLLHQVQQLSDVGARMQDRYERSLLESSLLASRQGNRFNPRGDRDSQSQDNTPPNSRFGLGELELDLFTPFHTLSQEIIELIVRVRESAADIEFLVDETDQVARMLRQITSQLQEGLTRSRMVPFANTADRLPRAVRDISIRCGKQAELHIEGRETLLDKVILEHLSDPMTHLINNAITHGIETPEVRKAAGKPPVGRITIRAFHQGNQTVISVSDDGAGVDAERVKSKAIEKGLITPEQATTMTRLDVYDLLFHPGFTTKDKEDEFAGRGIGMNVVRENLTEIRGVINTDSTLGKGTTFTVRLPLTLSICKALCCLIDRTRIAFPMDGVEDMLDVPQERIQTNAEGQTCIYWRDSLMPFQPLSELLTYNRHLSRGNVYGGKRDDDMISVVVLRSSGNYIAVQVDQVLGEQEIVIKQLEGPVPKPLGVAGATVLGDGRIMPIADVLELIDLATGRIGKDRGVSLWDKSGVPAPVEVPEVKTDPMVLIVDDSITVRELLSMTFNKAGYRVEQARDGQEAWDKLRSGLPCEIVFCDIEMPRMDGLELLSRIQKDPTLSHLPVAMLTSRGASKHQQMAAQFGAKGYFTKPYLEEVLLDAAQRMIKGEVLLSINSNA